MKTLDIIISLSLSVALPLSAQTATYNNFIRQIQFPSGVQWDMAIESSGERSSVLAIDPGGGRFELWAVSSEGPTSYLLSSNYVGTYIPLARVSIRSEDDTASIPRSRADRPVYVDVVVSGLRSGDDDPVPSKSVKFLRHVQSYGVEGTGVALNRIQALLISQSSIAANGTQTLTFQINAIPGADRSKVRGEERFSIFSLEDYQAPESELSSQTIQIWPVADGSIDGIAADQKLRFLCPPLTLVFNDLYPSSTTYAQVYKGAAQLGMTGTILPGSAVAVNDSVPQSRTLVVKNYEGSFDSDGLWTMELITVTPFGIDRLAHVSFNLDRTMKVNCGMNTIE